MRGIRDTPIITAIMPIPTGNKTPKLDVIAVVIGANMADVTLTNVVLSTIKNLLSN
jgi:hypothetical protein